jgi:pimeloyl-ACP methyl ester carboxylesterase
MLAAMNTGVARNGDVELSYEVLGAPDLEPLLLVMGLGMQRISWPDDFCAGLVERGFTVARFDNRDSGESTHFTAAGRPSVVALFTRPEAVAPYRLDDMADDAVAVLDALGWSSAHVVGASMGGMIAQALTVRHPERVRSLTSIMSTPEFVEPAPEMVAMLATPVPHEREAYIEHAVDIWRLLGGSGFPRTPADDDEARRISAMAYDRHFDPNATSRQLAAILASEPRRTALGGVRVPTVVIHGSADRLIPPIGGEMTAAAIPGSDLLVIEGMGHELPAGAWPAMVDAISMLTERAERLPATA